MRRFTILTVALASTVAFLVGLLLAGQLSEPVVTSAPRVAPPGGAGPRRAVSMGSGPASFADVAERVNASVVNIDTTSQGSALRDPRPPYPGYRREPPRDSDVPSRGAGSGFIVDRQGFILTNHHVIDNAERITVTLADGRAFRGEVVGTDPATDVALLKIPGAHDLPEVVLGNSDELRVGEWVCAIGNPLGYVHSVTVGVVSFVGRKLFDASLDDYIQTDAAINFGNSGGPLINTRGQVIGINSAVSSRTSSIGFAVPINQAVAILPQLKAGGRVSRGYMGVLLTDVTPSLQRALALDVARGALVQDVSDDSPAARAGLRVYDVVVDVEGTDIAGNEDLIRNIAARPPGSIARIEVMRDGRRLIFPVRLTERPQGNGSSDGDAPPRGPGARGVQPPDGRVDVPLGLTVRDIDRGLIGRLGIPDFVRGVIVSRVDPTGAAFSAHVRRGFVIIEINRRPVPTVADYQRVVGAAKPGDILAIFYYDPSNSQRAVLTVTVE
ncbi:MAG TPA: trypsin-like peptidase domain-containing protein [Vicinamibacterales bacterium]|nr:trypsin-like peptidase domain-containing protein [Vicinamibacterales bacterium]